MNTEFLRFMQIKSIRNCKLQQKLESRMVILPNGCVLICFKGKVSDHRPHIPLKSSNNNYYYASIARVLWALEYGDVPKSLNHYCDNSLCVNIDHMYNGTQQQNMQDAQERKKIKNKLKISGFIY